MITQESYLNKTDEEMVLLTLKDKRIYQYLMERYEQKLTRYIIRLSGAKKEDVEDILQEVFIKTYQKLNDFDAHFKFSSWIYRICHNETINYLRKINTKPKIINPETNKKIIDSLRADLNIQKDIDEKYLAKTIEKIINGLDRKYQEVIVLKYMEDKDYKEISDILKKPSGTIAILLKRAKEKLKREILKNKSFFQTYV